MVYYPSNLTSKEVKRNESLIKRLMINAVNYRLIAVQSRDQNQKRNYLETAQEIEDLINNQLSLHSPKDSSFNQKDFSNLPDLF